MGDPIVVDSLDNTGKPDVTASNAPEQAEAELFVSADKGGDGRDHSDSVGTPAGTQDGTRRSDQVLPTAVVCIAFLAGGFSFGIWGGTLVDLEKLLKTDTQMISTVFTCRAVGGVITTLFLGVLFDKLNTFFIMFVALVLTGIINAVIPLCGSLLPVQLLGVVLGSSLAFVLVGCTHACLRIWGAKVASYMQGIWLGFITGIMLAPLIARPFLAPSFQSTLTTQENHTRIQRLQINDTVWTTQTTNLSSIFYDENKSKPTLSYETAKPQSRIHYAFLIVGIIDVVVGMLSFVMFCRDSCKLRLSEKKQTEGDDVTKNRRCYTICLFALFLPFNMISVGGDTCFGGLVMTFLVKYLAWDRQKGASLVTLYYGFQLAARAVAVFAARFVKPNTIILFDLILTTTGIIVMIVAIDLHPIVPWVSAAIIGFGASTLYTCAVTWMNDIMKVSGRLLGLFTTGVPIGFMTIPVLSGSLMQKVDLKSFMYVNLSCWILDLIIYTSIRLLIRHEKQVKSSKRVSTSILELEGWHEKLNSTVQAGGTVA